MGFGFIKIFQLLEHVTSLIIEYFVLRARIDSLGEEYRKANVKSQEQKLEIAKAAAAKSSQEIIADFISHDGASSKSDDSKGRTGEP